MPTQVAPSHSTWDEHIYQAVQKHFKKCTKYETAVLEDTDPEPLHQMRVGLRRLRSTLQTFQGAIVLPKAAQEKRIRKIAKVLGAVRDLDVLREALERGYRPQLPPAEQKRLDQLLRQLGKQRRRDFSQLRSMLESSLYRNFKRAFRQWLDHPSYSELARLPVEAILPDLLLLPLSQVLLHPGWLVGTVFEAGVITIPTVTASPKLRKLIEQQGTLLHDLRKQMKRVRYQAEFFADFYGSNFAIQVEEFKTVQELLGQLQDSVVLQEFVAAQLDTPIETTLPTLVEQLQQERNQVWMAWKPLQGRYLSADRRMALRELVLNPPALELSKTTVALPLANDGLTAARGSH